MDFLFVRLSLIIFCSSDLFIDNDPVMQNFFPEIFDTSISLDVHTASGSHLITIKERSWQADGVAEGVYIVVAKLRDGGVITQRVVVQK